MRTRKVLLVTGALLWLLVTQTAAAASRPSWGAAASVASLPGAKRQLNSPLLEGCPLMSGDGKRLYFASNRPGGLGGLDIWVAERARPDGPLGAPTALGAPINSAANELCLSPLADGQGFLFASNRPGGCGGTDIYVVRRAATGGWEVPVNLGCHLNSSADEVGPSLTGGESGQALYFSSNRPCGPGGSDLYVSHHFYLLGWQPATLVPGVNSPYHDVRPYISHDGRELLFDSNRPGGLGSADIWRAAWNAAAGRWSAPENLGPRVNSAAGETGAVLATDGNMLLFGSNRPGGEGSGDIYYAWRD